MKHSLKKAFTLVEMMVSLAIFAIVVVVALGALARIITANQKAQTLQTAINNLSSALDSMSRDIRLGTNYYCFSGNVTPSFSGNGIPLQPVTSCGINNSAITGNGYMSGIAFYSIRTDPMPNNNCPYTMITAYRIYNNGGYLHLQKAEQLGCNQTINANNFYDVISTIDSNNSPNNGVLISDYRFGVLFPPDKSGGGGQGSYPYVFLRLVGDAGQATKIRTHFDIQTSISSREPQI